MAGALEGGMSASIGLRMGNERRGGFKMDLCKRWHLQCERSVVHSGKSLSRALLVEVQQRRESIMPTCYEGTGKMLCLSATGGYV